MRRVAWALGQAVHSLDCSGVVVLFDFSALHIMSWYLVIVATFKVVVSLA